MAYYGYRAALRGTPGRAVSNLELAWAAGVLEGEGCFKRNGGNFKRGLPGTTQHITVGQKDPEILLQLKEMFGGYLNHQDRRYASRAGTAEYEIWNWGLTGPRARGVMLTVYPFMSERRKAQIRDALKKTGEA